MNDPFLIECAQQLARRVMTEAPLAEQQRIDHLFRLCLGRAAQADERQAVADLLTTARQTAEASQQDLEHAAWTQAARVILNLDEFVTRE